MRYLFVDEILELTPGESIKAVKRIMPDQDYFSDHFPNYPVVPGVLLTEMMARSAGKCLSVERKDRGEPILTTIEKANFRDWVFPGAEVIVNCQITVSRKSFAKARCNAEVGGRSFVGQSCFFVCLNPVV